MKLIEQMGRRLIGGRLAWIRRCNVGLIGWVSVLVINRLIRWVGWKSVVDSIREDRVIK